MGGLNIQGTPATKEKLEEAINLWVSLLRMRKNVRLDSKVWPPMVDRYAWPGEYRTLRYSCKTIAELKSIGELVCAEDPLIHVEGRRDGYVNVMEIFEEPPPCPYVPEERFLNYLRTDGIEPDMFLLYVIAASSSGSDEGLLDFSLTEILLFSDILGEPHAYTARGGWHRPSFDLLRQNKLLAIYPTTNQEVDVVCASFEEAYQSYKGRWFGRLYSDPFKEELAKLRKLK